MTEYSTLWAGVLPEPVAAGLLVRWREPHRRYHGLRHLADGMAALDRLGGGRLERVAFWFHDAVHTGSSPADEGASAELARRLLADAMSASEVEEVCRLVLITAAHDPEPGDRAGGRVADADLHPLGSSWESYAANLAAIRVELPGLTEGEWAERRRAFIARLLGRDRVFATGLARDLWEEQARRNLEREAALLVPTAPPVTTRREAGTASA
ncbi:MAG: metal-dependent phosphohydrolase [Arachnia sp.]